MKLPYICDTCGWMAMCEIEDYIKHLRECPHTKPQPLCPCGSPIYHSKCLNDEFNKLLGILEDAISKDVSQVGDK